MKAIWNDKDIAESDSTINIEGNQYFPIDSVNKAFFVVSDTQTVCHWKGTASYYDVIVDGKINKDAAWFYPEPSKLADKIKNYVAFWHGVLITE
jgi:uncharacterized protein (DUF427 family)